MSKNKITTTVLQEMKDKNEKITMLTAYDYPLAKLVDESEIDIILVGDSLGMVFSGYENTLPVTMEEMLYHTKAVCRGVTNALVVADMPFMSYQISVEEAVRNAGMFIKEGRATAVKLEGGVAFQNEIRAIVRAGIPVMGHVGLTPQSVHEMGGYKVQGKTPKAAQKVIEDAKAVEEAGAFSVVLECVPADLAKEISSKLKIPTIGIGAGPDCDGQVLVIHDLIGLFERFLPKFVKRYANIADDIRKAVTNFKDEVVNGHFPDTGHSF